MSEKDGLSGRKHGPVLVFAASRRSDSLNRKLARVAAGELTKANMQATLVELRDYPMPLYDGDLEAETGTPKEVRAFQELMRVHDGLVIASPEFNGSFSALLKNLVDWVSLPIDGEGPTALFQGKTAALLSASPGRNGGQRGLRHLRELLEMVGVNVISEQLSIGKAADAFDSAGDLKRAQDRSHLEKVLYSLRSALRAGITTPA